jgi:multidrug efflux pump subunit AcrA (membrane-fusion protein)
MSLDDEEEDKEDVQDLLDEAKKASKNESFNKANELLKKAKQYSTNLVDVKNTQSLVDTKKQQRDARLEKARLARLEKQRQEKARLQAQRQRYNNSHNYGLSKDKCYLTNNNFALYSYCTTGSCIDFNSNYALYQLCKNDDAYGFYGSSRNVNISLYLRDGGYLSYDYFSDQAAYQSGKHNESFRTRKNFILYLMSGMVLVKY